MCVPVLAPATILLLGPTAGGKTALSIALARALPGGGVCIGADSMQVYRGMDIGTAKPTAAERAAAPHAMLDLVAPDDDGFTVDTWLKLARTEVERTLAAGRWPIVVGGTNLYVKAFLDGLFEGPAADPALRERLAALPLDTLRAELERVDPAAASRIHRNDTRRTIRALEVFAATGVPLSAHQRQWRDFASGTETVPGAVSAETGTETEPGTGTVPGAVSSDRTIIIGLDHPVEAINRRINARVKAMMEAGFLDEVRALHAAGKLGRQAREALGYKQLIDHLEGRQSLDDAVEQIKIASRRFGKQQRTWLKRFRALPNARFLAADSMDADALLREAMAFVDASTGATQR